MVIKRALLPLPLLIKQIFFVSSYYLSLQSSHPSVSQILTSSSGDTSFSRADFATKLQTIHSDSIIYI